MSRDNEQGFTGESRREEGKLLCLLSFFYNIVITRLRRKDQECSLDMSTQIVKWSGDETQHAIFPGSFYFCRLFNVVKFFLPR